jgi:hypothetical protein
MLHISLDLFMLKKRQEKKIHVFEYMREAQVHIWAGSENFHSHKFKNKNNSRGKRKFDGKNKAT